MTKIIAMIPARMGSKRVPKKNIRLMHGKPLIQYAMDNASEAGCFDEIWVNSESDLLGDLARTRDINFHKRPAALATDTATNQDFMSEFLRNHECDWVVMVNPTSPLLLPDTVRQFCDFIRDSEFDTVFSILEERAECLLDGKPVNFVTHKKINSQDLNPVQKIVWAVTGWRREPFLASADRGECSVFGGRLGLFPVDEREAADIDTQEQWDLAEAMLAARMGKQGAQPEYWGDE